ncbi:MAG: elongation factor Ts [bacterium]|nr:elongation factor Ts [bacterium]
MEITTESIKELREMTGVSVMQCKKALIEAEGDISKAAVILKKHSSASALKKAGRDLKASTIGSYTHDGSIGAMVLLSCETDFVAKNPEFVAFARELAMQVAATSPIYGTVAEIPSEARDTATTVFQREVSDKPKEMQEKILEGKLASYFKDQVLLEQSFIKDESKTIHDLLDEATQKFGERVEITRFVRLSSR